MSTVTIRLNEDEKKLFEEYSRFHAEPLSTLFKKTLEEKIEEELDMVSIKEYEERKEKGGLEYHSHDQVKSMLDL